MGELRAQVAGASGIATHNQLLVLAEERARTANLGVFARRMQRQWAARPELKTLIVQSINIAFIPEMLNRCPWMAWSLWQQAPPGPDAVAQLCPCCAESCTAEAGSAGPSPHKSGAACSRPKTRLQPRGQQVVTWLGLLSLCRLSCCPARYDPQCMSSPFFADKVTGDSA